MTGNRQEGQGLGKTAAALFSSSATAEPALSSSLRLQAGGPGSEGAASSADSRKTAERASAEESVCGALLPPSTGGDLGVDAVFLGSGLHSTFLAAALSRRGLRCLIVEAEDSYGGCYRNMRLQELLRWAAEEFDVAQGDLSEEADNSQQQLKSKGLRCCACPCHAAERSFSAGGCRSAPLSPTPSSQAPHVASAGAAAGESLGLTRLLKISRAAQRQPRAAETPDGAGGGGRLGATGFATEPLVFSNRWFSFGPFLEPSAEAYATDDDGETSQGTETEASSTGSASTDATAETTYTITTTSTSDTAQTQATRPAESSAGSFVRRPAAGPLSGSAPVSAAPAPPPPGTCPSGAAAGSAGGAAARLTTCLEEALAEAALAASRAASASAEAAAADAARAAGEPEGGVFAQRLQMRHELLGGRKAFAIDLTPRVLYTASPVVQVLQESGAGRYLEFAPLDASVFTADVVLGSVQNQDDPSFRAAQPQFQQPSGEGEDPPSRGARLAGSSHQTQPRGGGGEGGRPLSELVVLGENSEEEALARRRAAGEGSPAGANFSLRERLVLEPTPTSRSQVFQSASLSLAERRQLMKFISKATKAHATVTAAAFASPAKWKSEGTKESSEKGKDGETQQEGETEEGELLKSGVFGNPDACWDCFLEEEEKFTQRLRRILTYGVCLCDLPLEAASVGCLPDRLLCSKKKHYLRWRLRDGLARLQLFVDGCGLYSCKEGPWIFPLYGAGDIPQAFTRAASLSDALCMLSVKPKRMQFVRASVATGEGGEGDMDGLDFVSTSETAKEMPGAALASLSAAEAAFELQRSSCCCVLHLTNGERVATKLLFYEREAFSWQSSGLQWEFVEGPAQTVKIHPSNKASSSDARRRQALRGEDASPPQSEEATASLNARKKDAGGKASSATKNAAASAPTQPPPSSVRRSCRLIAITTAPLLGGAGFRMAVLVAGLKAANGEGEGQSSSIEQSEESSLDGAEANDDGVSSSHVHLPVHVLQADARCAVAPPGFFLLHFSHVCSPAAPCQPLGLHSGVSRDSAAADEGGERGAAETETFDEPKPRRLCGCCRFGASSAEAGRRGHEDASSRAALPLQQQQPHPASPQTTTGAAVADEEGRRFFVSSREGEDSCLSLCGCPPQTHCCRVLLGVLKELLRTTPSGLGSCYFLCGFRVNSQVEGDAAAKEAEECGKNFLSNIQDAIDARRRRSQQQQHKTAEGEATGAGVSASRKLSQKAAEFEAGFLCLSASRSAKEKASSRALRLDLPGCGVLSLPDVCGSPAFVLLREFQEARRMLEKLVRRRVSAGEFVPKTEWQRGDEEAEAARRREAPYEELRRLVAETEAAPIQPTSSTEDKEGQTSKQTPPYPEASQR